MIFKINNYVFEYPKPRFDLTLAIVKYLEFLVNEKISELDTLEEVREIAGIGKTFKGNNGHEFDFKVVFNENKISNLVKKLDSLIESINQNVTIPKSTFSNQIETLSYIQNSLDEYEIIFEQYKTKLKIAIRSNNLSYDDIEFFKEINHSITAYNTFIDELEKIFVQDSYGFNIVFNKNDKLYNILMNTKQYKIETLDIPNNPIIGENLACEEER